MRIIWIAVLLQLWLVDVNAQLYRNYNRDSLRTIAFDLNAADTSRVQGLRWLAMSFDPCCPDSMMYYARLLKAEADKIHDLIGFITYYSIEGYNLQYQGKWKEALNYHMKALDFAEQLGDNRYLMNAYTNVGNNYTNMMILDIALVYHNKAYDLARSLREPGLELTSLVNLAIVYEMAGNTDKSIEINKHIIALTDSIPSIDISNKAAAMHNLASNLITKGLQEEALQYLLQAYDLNEKYQNWYFLKQNLQLLGDLFENDRSNRLARLMHDNRTSADIALHYLSELEQIALKDEDTSCLVSLYIGMSHIYKDQGNPEQALNILNEGLAWMGHDESAETPLAYYDGLANLYASLGNDKMAGEFYRKRIAYSDSLDQVRIAEKVSQLSESYEIKSRDQQLTEKERKIKDKIAINYLLAALMVLTILIAVILFISYTQKRKAEKALKKKNHEVEEARAKAEQNEKFKEQFLANMSHEIRTPLNTVIGMTDLLLDERQSPETESYLKKIKQAGEHLLVIINDILDLSKVSAGKLELVPTPTVLKEFLEEMKDMFQLKAKEKELVLVMQMDPGAPEYISVDHHRIKQVLVNLIGNAIKFTEKGSVTLKVSVVERDGENCKLQFSVTDTGRGISKEKQSVIFEEFVQLRDTRELKFPGTGLGLAISRKLVEIMGGELKVESQPGIGSVFFFTIPVDIVSDAEMETYQVQLEKPVASMHGAYRILVVDDNRSNQIVTEGHLERLLPESVILTSDSGYSALEMISKDHIDLVLMDIQMPGMDGYETTRKIRQLQSEASKVPVIALTASVIKADIQRCLEAGMNIYVPKPIDRNTLAKAIFSYLGKDKVAGPEDRKVSPGMASREIPDQPEWAKRLYLNCNNKMTRFIRYLDIFIYELNYELGEWDYLVRRKQYKKLAGSVHKLIPQIKILSSEETYLLSVNLEHTLRTGWDDSCAGQLKELKDILIKIKEDSQALLRQFEE